MYWSLNKKITKAEELYYDYSADAYYRSEAYWSKNVFSDELMRITPCLGDDSRILDIACGTGHYFEFLNSNAKIYGIDLSKNMLSCAYSRISHSNLAERVTLLKHDMNDALPFPVDHFSLIFSFGFFDEHFKLDSRVVADIYRVLKESGVFLFTVKLKRSENLLYLGKRFLKFLIFRLPNQLFIALKSVFPTLVYGYHARNKMNYYSALEVNGFKNIKIEYVKVPHPISSQPMEFYLIHATK